MNERKSRVDMLDMARLLGMALVYYGHAVERIMYLENPVATIQYKFIYSFHMPFFFLLSGMTLAPSGALPGLGRYLKKLAASRMVPYFVFTLLLLVLSLLFTGHFVVIPLDSLSGYLHGLFATLMGFPVFNIPLWFLSCLVSVELLHGLVGRYLKTMPMILGAALVCYLGGYYLTATVQFVPGPNVWFLHEAVVMYAFYLVGVALRRTGWIESAGRGLAAGLALACLAVVTLTFDLNQGPFRLFQAVVIVLSGHGNVVLFPLTALAGSVMLLALGRLMGSVKPLLWLGENVLILFCLNGVFYHFFNGPFADAFVKHLPGDWFSVTWATAAFAFLSMLACVPLVWLIRTYLPQLAGRPAENGPLLPAFLAAPASVREPIVEQVNDFGVEAAGE